MPFFSRIIVVNQPKQVFQDRPIEKDTVLLEQVFLRKKGNIDKINFLRNLFSIVEKCLNFIQICVRRKVFWKTN